MILTCHLLIGAAIASKIQPAPLALGLAFLSHYFLDFIPHQEYSLKNIFEKRWRKSKLDFLKIFLDFSFGILLILLFSKNPCPKPDLFLGFEPIIYAGAFFAVLPDGFTFLALIFEKSKILGKHHRFHQNTIHLFKVLEDPALLTKERDAKASKNPPHPRSLSVFNNSFSLEGKVWTGFKIFSQVLVISIAIFFLL